MIESHPILQMSKLSLLKGRQPIHHMILPPHIQGANGIHLRLAPKPLSPLATQFSTTDPPVLARPTVHSGTNLWVAATWDKAPWGSQPCRPRHNKQVCFQSVLNPWHETSWSQLVGPEQRLRAGGPAHSAESSKQEAVPLATSMKLRALLSVLLSFRYWGRKSEAGGRGKETDLYTQKRPVSPPAATVFAGRHRHVTWPSLG